MSDFINSSPEAREIQFKKILKKDAPTLHKLFAKADDCEDGLEIVHINANFIADIELEVYKLIVSHSLVENKLNRLEKESI